MIARSFQFSHPDAQLTLRQAAEKYHQSPDHSPRYQGEMTTTLDHWERCTDNPSVGEISNATMLAFRNRFLSTPLPSRGRLPSPATFNKVLRQVTAILSKLGPPGYKNPFSLGIIDEHPRAEPAREHEPEVVVASAEQVSLIYRHCEVATRPDTAITGCRPVDLFQALVVYLWNVGSRRNDFKALRKEHVHFGQQVIFLRQGKTKKFRPVPMLPVVAQHLNRIWSHPHERVFPFARNDHELYTQWREIQKAAGIVVPRPEGSDRLPYFGFHELRKSCLTEFAGVSEVAAQQMGAHSKLATTMRHYISATRQQGKLRQAAEQIQQPEAFLKFG